MNRRFRIGAAILAATLLLTVPGCSSGKQGSSESKTAEAYPTKPINLIVPFTAGSAADLFARTLAKAAEKDLGQTIVVQNKPGGSGAVALAYVLSQPADGYTLATHSVTLVSLFAGNQVPFKPEDLTFIARINGESSSLMVKAGDNRFKTMDDFIAYAKDHPGQLKVGGPGSGSFHHMVATELQHKAGIKFTWIPFEGGKEAAMALLGGNVDAAVATPSNAKAQIDAGQIKVLAVSTAKRSAGRPEVPTFKESGIDIEEILWRGVMTRAGLPQERLTRLETAFANALKDPDWAKYMHDFDQEDAFLKSDEFTKVVQSEIPATRQFMEEIGALKK